MTGEEVLKTLAGTVVTIATVGGAILWIARLAAGQVVAAQMAEIDRRLDEGQREIAGLRAEVAELRGAARPTLAAVDRLLHALEGGRR